MGVRIDQEQMVVCKNEKNLKVSGRWCNLFGNLSEEINKKSRKITEKYRVQMATQAK